MKPYYEDERVTIYHGDSREVSAWLDADVLVTDPPYGVAFRSGWTGAEIANDHDLSARDHILEAWGDRPALVFAAAGEVRHPQAPCPPLVWHRRGSGMGNLKLPWKPDYELVHVLGSGFTADTRGTSVLSYPWDTFRGSAHHPHQKPVDLMRDLIGKCPPGVIADPFMGSGSTLRAAADLGRRAIGVEVDERYCQIAVRRLAQQALDLDALA